MDPVNRERLKPGLYLYRRDNPDWIHPVKVRVEEVTYEILGANVVPTKGLAVRFRDGYYPTNPKDIPFDGVFLPLDKDDKLPLGTHYAMDGEPLPN